jgi:hypothetical protein
MCIDAVIIIADLTPITISHCTTPPLVVRCYNHGRKPVIWLTYADITPLADAAAVVRVL